MSLASGPADCCTRGVRHEGVPVGQDFNIGGFTAYIATPEPAKAHKDAAILYLPDIIGVYQNSKLIADDFAAQGYLCLLIDIYNGDTLTLNRSPGFDFPKWVAQGTTGDNPHTAEVIDKIVVLCIEWLKGEKGIKKIGAVGYCFGARFVFRHYPSVSVGYIAHPSNVDEEELALFKAPLSIAAAETDHLFPVEKRHKAEAVLMRGGYPYQINLYGMVEHGFCVRCDLSQKIEKYAKEAAFHQAVMWFNTWLL